MKDPAGNAAPSGGFQNLGWYSGYQFYNGSFAPKAGMIHPNSPQQGAGQPVSAEVNKQSDAAQGLTPGTIQAYVDKQNSVVPKFNDTGQVQDYLNGQQNQTYQSTPRTGTPGVRSTADIVAEAKTFLPTNAPNAPKLVDTYQTLSAQYGLDALQTTINDLTAQDTFVRDQLRASQGNELGKPVPLNVIEGRMTEEQRAANEKLTYIGEQKARALDQYNSALNTVKTIMDFTQTDFTNAKSVYDSQFSQALSLMNYAQGVKESEKTDVQRAIDNARANLTVITAAMKDGSINPANLTPDQRANINALEVQAGLPIGFTAMLKTDPKADVVSITSNEGQIQVLKRNPDGTMALQTYGTKNTTTTQAKATAISDMTKRLIDKSGPDGYVSAQTWQDAKALWLSAGYQTTDFDSNFRNRFTNPNQPPSYYGFSSSSSTADVLQGLVNNATQ